jgi:hypothetical protein
MGVFPVGNSPYTYSDATGLSAFTNTAASGKWTVVQDSAVDGNKWEKVTWNTEPEANVPSGASISVAARAADTQAGLTSKSFVPVSNGEQITDMLGRFIEVQVTLAANSSNQSPVLSDITITGGDVLPPSVTAPDNITSANDAGSCSASLDPGAASGTDNSGASPTIAGTRSDGLALGDPYPIGETTITWTATDAAGNIATATRSPNRPELRDRRRQL